MEGANTYRVLGLDDLARVVCLRWLIRHVFDRHKSCWRMLRIPTADRQLKTV